MWVFRYVRELGTWAFARWRVHQAVVGALLIAAGLFGVTRVSTQPQVIGAYLLGWLAFLTLVVAPARLWHQQDERLQPAVAFVDHEDDHALDHNAGIFYRRGTIKNRSAVLLTGVEVLLVAIDPRPDGFMTLHVPLQPMHAPPESSRFMLQPGMHCSVNVLSMDLNSLAADIWHVVDAVPRQLPLGQYRMKFIVTTDQTPPMEQWFKAEVGRQTEPRLSLTLLLAREDDGGRPTRG